MYKVLIVDDEPIIRNGIKAFIDWEKEGLSAEADCANGEEALAAMEESSADILITDIKMPVMNGIQLMEKASERNPRIKMIMVSSYSDFEYVREGIKLGAVDYLLKPTLEPEELLSVLRKCTSMLEEERRRESERIVYQSDAVYRERKRLEQEIKRRIVREQTPPPADSRFPEWLKESVTYAYVLQDGTEEMKENQGLLHAQLLQEELQESFYHFGHIGTALPVAEGGLFLLLPDNAGDAELKIRDWKRYVEEQMDISVSIGVVSIAGVGSISEGYAVSRNACQQRFFDGLGGVYAVKRTENATGLEHGIESRHSMEPLHDRNVLIDRIRQGATASALLDQAVARWKSGGLTPGQVKQEACSLLSAAYHLYADAGFMLPERLDLLRKTESLEHLVSSLARQLEEIRKPVLPKLADKGYSGQLVAKALDYMAVHYKVDITLQDVADIVHVSKSYFSLLFKKQTGQNFIDYLIDLRIREAKRLLTGRESKIYEVAESAGFHDVKYFSKLFKKLTGLTPVEYKEKHQTS